MGRFFGILPAVLAAGCLGDYTQTTYGESRARSDVGIEVSADADDVSDALVVPDGEADVFTPIDAALDVAEAGEDALDADASDAGDDVIDAEVADVVSDVGNDARDGSLDADSGASDAGADVVIADAFDAGTPDVTLDAPSDARDGSADVNADAGADVLTDTGIDTGMDSGPRTITLEPAADGDWMNLAVRRLNWNDSRSATAAQAIERNRPLHVAAYNSMAAGFNIERGMVRFPAPGCEPQIAELRFTYVNVFGGGPQAFRLYRVNVVSSSAISLGDYDFTRWNGAAPLGYFSTDTAEGMAVPLRTVQTFPLSLGAFDWTRPIFIGLRHRTEESDTTPPSVEAETYVAVNDFRLIITCR